MEENIISIIYITLFIFLSVALYIVVIPSKKEFNDYKISRRVLGFGLIMIAALGIARIFFLPQEAENYTNFSITLLVSQIFNSLNFISFLYMIETSKPKRRLVTNIAAIGCTISMILISAGFVFPACQNVIKIILSFIYPINCIVIFTRCLREYDKFMLQMSNFYDSELNIKWIPGMLWASFILSVVMEEAFFNEKFYIITGLGSIIIYSIIAMKLLSFIPANIHVVRVKVEENKIIAKEEELKLEKKYEKTKILVDRWVAIEHYTKPEINIKDVATEMGTNTNYLSTYINNVLNTSFSTWLNTLRIEKSKEYLNGKEKISMEELGFKVGYTSLYNFSRWFKIVTGMSPSEWKKNNCA